MTLKRLMELGLLLEEVLKQDASMGYSPHTQSSVVQKALNEYILAVKEFVDDSSNDIDLRLLIYYNMYTGKRTYHTMRVLIKGEYHSLCHVLVEIRDTKYGFNAQDSENTIVTLEEIIEYVRMASENAKTLLERYMLNSVIDECIKCKFKLIIFSP